MSDAMTTQAAAEPLFEFDKKARKAFLSFRGNRVMRALDAVGDVGDQPPMRLLCGGLLAFGLVRGDARMVRAGGRMLLSHELATALKTTVKHRIDRSRPRSANGSDGHKPSRGHDRSKEESSFPSGHAAGSMAVACAFAAEYPAYRAAALTASGAIGLSRIPTCAHYPSDVAAGWAIGAVAEAVVGLAWRAASMVVAGNGLAGVLFSRTFGGRRSLRF
jgi:undecaprenyl-diphosphatase